jgi:hypothetical protein
VIFGVNAVAIYMSQSIIAWHKIVGIFTGPLKPTLGPVEPLLEVIIVLGVEWSVLYWMYKRKIRYHRMNQSDKAVRTPGCSGDMGATISLWFLKKEAQIQRPRAG